LWLSRRTLRQIWHRGCDGRDGAGRYMARKSLPGFLGHILGVFVLGRAHDAPIAAWRASGRNYSAKQAANDGRAITSKIMKFVEPNVFADSDVATRKLVEIANEH